VHNIQRKKTTTNNPLFNKTLIFPGRDQALLYLVDEKRRPERTINKLFLNSNGKKSTRFAITHHDNHAGTMSFTV
jgi:hypothetical protein